MLFNSITGPGFSSEFSSLQPNAQRRIANASIKLDRFMRERDLVKVNRFYWTIFD